MNRIKQLFTRTPTEKLVRDWKVLHAMRSGIGRAKFYYELQIRVRQQQGTWLEIVCSGVLDDIHLGEAISFGGHGGSVAKENNIMWHDFMQKLRQRRDELPFEATYHLDWLWEVHNW